MSSFSSRRFLHNRVVGLAAFLVRVAGKKGLYGRGKLLREPFRLGQIQRIVNVALKYLPIVLILRGVEGVIQLQLLHQRCCRLDLQSTRPEFGKHGIVKQVVRRVKLEQACLDLADAFHEADIRLVREDG